MTDKSAVRLRAHPSVLCRELGGEMVLLNLESGIYFGLDAIGTRVWSLLAQEKTVDDVCAIMLDEYEVSADVLRGDLTVLVRDLLDKQLLIPSGSDPQ